MHAYDAESWHLPLFGGRVRATNLAFHFWDVTDDFSGAAMDLVFEGHRLYLHNARGCFGAVPLTITGLLQSVECEEALHSCAGVVTTTDVTAHLAAHCSGSACPETHRAKITSCVAMSCSTRSGLRVTSQLVLAAYNHCYPVNKKNGASYTA